VSPEPTSWKPSKRQQARTLLGFLAAIVFVAGVFVSQRPEGSPRNTPSGLRDPRATPWHWSSVWNMPLGAGVAIDKSPLIASKAKIGSTSTFVIDSTDGKGSVSVFQVGSSDSVQACATPPGLKIIGVAIPQSTVELLSAKVIRPVAVAMPNDVLVEFDWLTVCPDKTVRTSSTFVRQNIKQDLGQIGPGGPGGSLLGGVQLSTLGGRLSAQDFQTSSVNHALSLFVNPKSLVSSQKMSGAVWPARATAAGTQGDLNIGSLLALPANFSIASLRSAPARSIATALKNYGGYVVGTSATSPVSFGVIDDVRGGTNSQLMQQFQVSFTPRSGCSSQDCVWQKDLAKISAGLRRVTNSGPGSVGGPGVRRTPCAASFNSASEQTPASCQKTGFLRGPKPVTVLAIGDSLTEGGGPGGHVSYRIPLQKVLRTDGQIIDFVGSKNDGTEDPEHEGHSGFTVGPDNSRFCTRPASGSLQCRPEPFNLAEILPTILAGEQPDVVILWIGLNDTFNEEIQPGSQGINRTQKFGEAPGKIDALVKRLRSTWPSTEIFVATLSPTKFGFNDSINAINDGIREQMVLSRSGVNPEAGLQLIELADLGLSESDFADGVHFSQSGASRVAERVLVSIQSSVRRRSAAG
jgi:lysophospholipase L1-like esterase